MSVRQEILKEQVRDVTLEELEPLSDAYGKLIKYYKHLGGFTTRYLSKAADIMMKIYSDDTLVILSFPANIVATGLRGLLSSLIRRGLVDLVITTGGTFDHDIARSEGGIYYKGWFEFDDKMLRELEIHRLGSILIPLENYGPIIEKFTHHMLEELIEIKDTWTPSELAEEIGKRLKDRNSILREAYLKEVKIFCPGIVDSAFGTALFTYGEVMRSRKGVTLKVDVLEDMKNIANIVYKANKLAGIILGGGIAKHHLIWWAQFKGGLDYAIQITSAPEWDGSLSGARTREAISWGKIKPTQYHVTIPGDITIILPLLAAGVLSKINRRR